MAINLASPKLIGCIAGTGTAIIGGGVGVGFYLKNKNTNNQTQSFADTVEDPNIDGLSQEIKEFLKNQDDFVIDKNQTTNFILARVVTVTEGKTLSDSTSKCSIESGQESDCKLHLIQTKLKTNNIGKVLYSSLKPLRQPNTESPKDSYIVVEFINSQKNLDGFKNKAITIKQKNEAALTASFDQVLFKESKNINDTTIEIIKPLKKNIVSYLAYSQQIRDLFKTDSTNKSFSCSFQKAPAEGEVGEITSLNVDDSCRIIKIDYPTDTSHKLITLQALLASSSLFTKEDLKPDNPYEPFKIEVDKNKFYNVDLDNEKFYSNIDIQAFEGNKKSEIKSFLISKEISGNQVKGKVKWMVVKYTGENKAFPLIKDNMACGLNKQTLTTQSSTAPYACELYQLETPTPLTVENFTTLEISNANLQTQTTLTKDAYYAIFKWTEHDMSQLTPNTPIYFAPKQNATQDKMFDFQIVALLAEQTDPKTKQGILISEIKLTSS